MFGTGEAAGSMTGVAESMAENMKGKAKTAPAGDDSRLAEATKTNRLRALRLAKEVSDKEAAAREAALNPPKPARTRAASRA